ncbi:replication initiation protein [Helicobacter pylori]|nr:replication initiation protein [Helicobacter pylori]
MGKNKALNFRFHSDLNLLNLSFLGAVEYSFLMAILYNLKDKGDGLVELNSYDLRLNIVKKYLNGRYNKKIKSMHDKLKEHGFIGDDKDALFELFELVGIKNLVKSIKIKLKHSKSYLFNNVKNNYTSIDLSVFQNLSTFTAKALYCWYCRNNYKQNFFIPADKLLGVLGINIHSNSADIVKIKNALKCLSGVGIDLEVTKNKSNRSLKSTYSFTFTKSNHAKQKQVDTATPPTIQATNNHTLDSLISLTYKKNDELVRLAKIYKNGAYYKAWFESIDKQGGFFVNIKDYAYLMDYLTVNGFIKQDKAMISGVKTNQNDTPTPFKEDDALTRFKNSAKTLNKNKATPNITPTIKNANNKQIQANNEILNKFENIVLTSPKYFDYVIKSVTQN